MFSEVAARIQLLPETLKAKALETVEAALNEAAELARQRVPVRTGRLKASIRVEPSEGGFTLKAGGAQAPYAVFVEEKTGFLTQSFLDVLPFLTEKLKELEEDLNEYVNSGS